MGGMFLKYTHIRNEASVEDTAEKELVSVNKVVFSWTSVLKELLGAGGYSKLGKSLTKWSGEDIVEISFK